jgi:hypothetical protein
MNALTATPSLLGLESGLGQSERSGLWRADRLSVETREPEPGLGLMHDLIIYYI